MSGLGSTSLNRISSMAAAAQRQTNDGGQWIRDFEEGPDGSLWPLDDAPSGGLIHWTPN